MEKGNPASGFMPDLMEATAYFFPVVQKRKRGAGNGKARLRGKTMFCKLGTQK